MREPSIRLPAAHCLQTDETACSSVATNRTGETLTVRWMEKALLCKMCLGLLFGRASSKILAMKSRCCSGIVIVAPPLAG